MSFHDKQYLNLVDHVLQHGTRKPNRTGVDTIGIFAYQMRFDLSDGTIPLLTTKKMHTRSIIHEILWYLKGTGNIQYLKDNNVTIWDEWANENGELGPVYGFQWRNWPTFEHHTHPEAKHMSPNDWSDAWFPGDPIDQIAELINKLKNNPNDRRMIVSAWNVADIPNMALPPCHYSFQLYAEQLSDGERLELFGSKYYTEDVFNVAEESNRDIADVLTEIGVPTYRLSLKLNQRSCDVGLGVPFNIVQYSILLRMFCEVANMVPGEFIWDGGDIHIYHNHIAQLKEQLERVPYPAPTFGFARKIDDIDDFKYEDFVIKDYLAHPSIKMDVAV